MNKNRQFQMVPDDLVKRCIGYAKDIVGCYASEAGKRSKSRVVSGNRGTVSNVKLQFQTR
jgi:hypothetical protein